MMTIAALAGACSEPAPPAASDLARAAAPAPAPAPTPAPVAAAPKPSMPPAEVELFGTVTAPKGAKGETRVFVTDGACWQPATHSLGDVRANETGGFFAEVMVRQGTMLWVCAALIPPKGPLTVYGALASAPLKGEGLGEVTFRGLTIALAPGKPVERPSPPATSPTAPTGY
jgi:hypothetical protein